MRKMTVIEALRQLTNIIDPKQAVNIIAFVNLLARKLDNCPSLQDNFLVEQFKKINIELILENYND